MEPLISIIIPIYNTEKYIDKCIKSLLTQTYSNIEIILINDGSLDNSKYICEKYAKEFGNITFVNQNNQGVSVARNNGLAVATGDYISFVDSDDYVVEDTYEHMMFLMKKYDADIVQCDRFSQNIDKVDLFEEIEHLTSEKAIIELMCSRKIRSANWAKLYKANLFENKTFYDELSTGEDFIMNYQLLKSANNIVVTNKKGYFYNNRSDSCTGGQIKEKYFRIFKYIDLMKRKEENKKLLKYWDLRKAMFAVNFLRRMIPNHDYSKFKEFREYIIDSRYVLLNPRKYKVSNDKNFHLHILFIWIFPKLYIKILLRGK